MIGFAPGLCQGGAAFHPETLGPTGYWSVFGGGRIWQDGASTLSAVENGSVGRIAGALGASRDLVQATAANMPKLEAGKRAIKFDGVDDFLAVSTAGYPAVREVHITTTLPATFSGEIYQCLFGAREANYTLLSYLVVCKADGIPQLWAGAGTVQLKVTGNTAALMGTRCVLGYSHDGTTVRLFVNGSQIGQASQSGSAAGTLTSYVGGLNISGSLRIPYSGKIETIVEFNRTLSDAERGQLVTCLAN
jgi:hypothetical protein